MSEDRVDFNDLSDDEGDILKNMDKMSPAEIELYLNNIQERIQELKSNKSEMESESESEQPESEQPESDKSESESEPEQPEPEPEQPKPKPEKPKPEKPKPEPEKPEKSESESDTPPEEPKLKPSKNDRKKVRQYEMKVRKVLRDFSISLAETLEPYKIKYRNATIDKFDTDDVVDIHNSMRGEATLLIEDIVYDMEDEGLDFTDNFYDYIEEYFQRQLERAEQLVL